MRNIRLTLENKTRRQLGKMLEDAENKGDLREAKRIMAILALAGGAPVEAVISACDVIEKTVMRWVENFLLNGPGGLKSRKPPGRKPRMTKSQKRELEKIITAGPAKAGFPGACRRSPMIQALIHERFGIFYAVNYISQLLKNMGFSYQKAKFVASRRDSRKRREWLEKVWPEIMSVAERHNAMILFGDEASFPQWGTLSYTWARRGKQPVVKTSGVRKSHKVLGLTDYFSGRFFHKGWDGRLNSAAHAEFLSGVMKKTGNRHLIIVQDGAPYHRSAAMREFFRKNSGRMTVYRLPGYSPDYNPIEMLWKKIKEKETHMHYFPTFESLKKKVTEALLRFENMRDEVLSLFGLYDGLRGKSPSGNMISFEIKA